MLTMNETDWPFPPSQEDAGCSGMKWEASLMVAWDDTSACSSRGELSYPPQGLQKDEEVEEEEEEDVEDELYEDYFNEEASGSRVRRGAHGANKKGRGKKACKLRSMYVNFREIGWNSWIIAPTGESHDNNKPLTCTKKCILNIMSTEKKNIPNPIYASLND